MHPDARPSYTLPSPQIRARRAGSPLIGQKSERKAEGAAAPPRRTCTYAYIHVYEPTYAPGRGVHRKDSSDSSSLHLIYAHEQATSSSDRRVPKRDGRPAMRFQLLAGLWAALVLAMVTVPSARADSSLNAWNELIMAQLKLGFSPFVSSTLCVRRVSMWVRLCGSWGVSSQDRP